MKINPIADYVALEGIKVSTTTDSGILLEDAFKGLARVVAVGPGKTVDGVLIPTTVKKDDIVCRNLNIPAPGMEYKGKVLLFYREDQLVCIVSEHEDELTITDRDAEEDKKTYEKAVAAQATQKKIVVPTGGGITH